MMQWIADRRKYLLAPVVVVLLALTFAGSMAVLACPAPPANPPAPPANPPAPPVNPPSSSQTNQQWFSYLGNPSGANYQGPIHPLNASDQCLTVPLSVDAKNPAKGPSGSQVELDTCGSQDQTKVQTWQQQTSDQGSWSYSITVPGTNTNTNTNTEYCLDSSLSSSKTNGSLAEIMPCQLGSSGANSQKWTISSQGQIQSVGSPSYCLDDTGGTKDGTPIQLSQCSPVTASPNPPSSSQTNQQWFSYLGNPSGANYQGPIHPLNASDQCLTVPLSVDANNPTKDPSGSQVELDTCGSQDQTKVQTWQQLTSDQGNWSYSIAVPGMESTYCLDSSLSSSKTNGSLAEIMPCQLGSSGANSQKWTIGSQGQIQSVGNPGYCLDDMGGTKDGAPIQLSQCTSTSTTDAPVSAGMPDSAIFAKAPEVNACAPTDPATRDSLLDNPDPNNQNLEHQIAQALFDAINKDRQANGLQPLKRDARLDASARVQDQVMSFMQREDHQFSCEPDPGAREQQQGMPPGGWAENIGAFCQPTLDCAMGWHQFMMNEQPTPRGSHRQNILGSSTLVGIDVMINKKGQLALTEDFAG